MFYYKTAYGSPEAAKVKAAGAKWNRNWKVWESEKEIPGISEAKPDHRLVNTNTLYSKKAMATVKIVNAMILGRVPNPDALEKFLLALGDTYEDKCILAALDLAMAVQAAGASWMGFWTRPAEEIEAEIDVKVAIA